MKMQSHMVHALAVMCFLQLYGVYGQSCNSPCTGGQICVYGTCTSLTNCECAANPESLVDCTFSEHTGDDEMACVIADCCWNKDTAKCHHKNAKKAATSCTNKTDGALRVDSGWKDISPNDCMCIGGCFDKSTHIEEAAWCFTERLKQIGVGDPCNPADVCSDTNAVCTNGTCQCAFKFNFQNGVCKEICKKHILDIVFTVDNSGSVGWSGLAEIDLFLTKLTESFTIDDTDTRVGLVKYGSGVVVVKPLNSRNTAGDVSAAIGTLDTLMGSTNTPRALTAMTNLFETQGGSHQELGVLLTDGRSNIGHLPSAIAAIPGDVTMFAVGVKGYVRSELEAIAGAADRVYATHEFDKLIELIPSIRKDMCSP